jgi:hypothetical protein
VFFHYIVAAPFEGVLAFGKIVIVFRLGVKVKRLQ